MHLSQIADAGAASGATPRVEERYVGKKRTHLPKTRRGETGGVFHVGDARLRIPLVADGGDNIGLRERYAVVPRLHSPAVGVVTAAHSHGVARVPFRGELLSPLEDDEDAAPGCRVEEALSAMRTARFLRHAERNPNGWAQPYTPPRRLLLEFNDAAAAVLDDGIEAELPIGEIGADFDDDTDPPPLEPAEEAAVNYKRLLEQQQQQPAGPVDVIFCDCDVQGVAESSRALALPPMLRRTSYVGKMAPRHEALLLPPSRMPRQLMLALKTDLRALVHDDDYVPQNGMNGPFVRLVDNPQFK